MPPEFAYASLDEVVRFFVKKQAEAYRGKIDISYSSSAHGSGWEDVSDSVSLEIYRIVQEAVGNAVKHSGCHSIHVDLFLEDATIGLTVADDGSFTAHRDKGIGLDSIRRRAESVGGRVIIVPGENGGTQVRLTVEIK